MAPATLPQLEREIDTEITLGTGKMLALFFGLVILCAVFFGMGFTMGKNSVKSAPELLPPAGTASRSAVGSKPASSSAAAPSQPAQAQPQTADATSNTTPTGVTQAAPGNTDQEPAPPPPLIPVQAYYVQVAAVSKQEDAQALVDALKGRQYSAFVSNTAPDKLFHVQVGPFTDAKEAENVRAKLVSDGYNPIVKR